MKKGRSGYLFSVLCKENQVENIEKTFFEETPTIGIRKYPVERTELARVIEERETALGKIRVKKSYYKNELTNLKVEHDDVVKISNVNNLSLKATIKQINKDLF